MKRDFDLIRALLMRFESRDYTAADGRVKVEGYKKLAIRYHLWLLHDAGLLVCEPTRSKSSDRVISVLPFHLSWEGHEFLDKIRDENMWERIKKRAAETGIALAFSTISTLAKGYIDLKLKGG